jgi:hypothetical protein
VKNGISSGTIRVIYSADQEKTWGEPLILMNGFWSEDVELNDLGYPQVVRRKDGGHLLLFYQSAFASFTRIDMATLRKSFY